MGAVATFDLAAWRARYPEFASTVSDALAALYFAEATLYLANDGTGPVEDATQQLMLLNMLTAHVAQIGSGSSLQGANGLVGPIQSASQGSVSVSVAVGAQPGSAAWYMSSKYGAAFYRATARYRTMQYRPGTQRVFL